MKELREDYLKKDEDKLMKAIHENYKNTRMERKMDEQIKQFSKKESAFSKLESSIKKAIIVLLIIAVVFIGYKYNEKQIKSCVESGNSETFCRYDGE